VNTDLTKSLCRAIQETGRKIPLLLASSIHVDMNEPYGNSKRDAESAVKQMSEETGNPVYIYRLPNVFGKWCKPNYNSVVATFCHNIANNLPIQVNNKSTNLRLVYVDDVVTDFLKVIRSFSEGIFYPIIEPEYNISLGALDTQINAFKNCRKDLIVEQVGTGLVRALYSTYMSYVSPDQFTYDLIRHGDERGVFVEMLKTKDSGQFSYFTAHPGITRGGHYHHSKTEKFLVIKGIARFGFRHIVTNESYEILISGEKPQVVETVPGWTHDITNIGEEEMLVMLWANEIFDKELPDTKSAKV
jgi:UDP-2-acetamido-2,6-beta-L-arabino-hexul-4-ose reductase